MQRARKDHHTTGYNVTQGRICGILSPRTSKRSRGSTIAPSLYCILVLTFAINDDTSFDLRAISTASSMFAEWSTNWKNRISYQLVK